jgi:Fe-S cluster biogenesis protein NfuA/nitrite reductase/ring-hydroxylating ferredoxin subunit
LDDHEVGTQVAEVEALLGRVEGLPDGAARETALELVQALLDLYGEGLGRVLAGLDDATRVALAEDELVAHLLLLHDLHPVPVETRVLQALDEVRPYLDSHGGGVELVGVDDGVARLRLHGSCDGCPSSTMTLKLAIEEAIQRAAPDVATVEAQGVAAPATAGPALLQLEVSDSLREADGGEGWAIAGGLPELSGGGVLVKPVSGEPVLFLRLEETFYAYRPGCPGCAESLEDAALVGAELCCAGCGRRYDVRRAGRCLDDPELYLEPFPLLLDDSGLVRVALGSQAVA